MQESINIFSKNEVTGLGLLKLIKNNNPLANINVISFEFLDVDYLNFENADLNILCYAFESNSTDEFWHFISQIPKQYKQTLLLFNYGCLMDKLHSIYLSNIIGYCCLFDSHKEILKTVETALKGKPYFSSAFKHKYFEEASQNVKSEILPNLTKRQSEIVQLISQGFDSKSIGEKLFISKHTVNNHRNKLLQDFEVNNTAHLVTKCFENNLLPML